jgi:hypothetical protein
MVATETLVPLAASFKLDGMATINRDLTRMDNKPNVFRETKQSGLDLEKEPRLRPRRSFFLDIPFYRTH